MAKMTAEIKESYRTMSPDKFYIVSWDTGKLLGEYTNIEVAKKACRKLGGTPKNGPVAFVGQLMTIWGEPTPGVVYNPKFKN